MSLLDRIKDFLKMFRYNPDEEVSYDDASESADMPAEAREALKRINKKADDLQESHDRSVDVSFIQQTATPKASQNPSHDKEYKEKDGTEREE